MLYEIAMASGLFPPTYQRSFKPRVCSSSGNFDEIFKFYSHLFTIDTTKERATITNSIENITELFDPDQIQMFLNLSQRCEQEKEYAIITGLVTSRLIQNSHHHGHGSFTLDLRSTKPIDYLCSDVQQEHPLTVRIIGKAGNHFGRMSIGGTYHVDEVDMMSFYKVKDGTYHVGKIGFSGADGVTNANFYIGKVDNTCANRASSSKFYVLQAGHGFGSWSDESTFCALQADFFTGQASLLCTFFIDSIGLYPPLVGKNTLYIRNSPVLNPLKEEVTLYTCNTRLYHRLQVVPPAAKFLLTSEEWIKQWRDAEQGFAIIREHFPGGSP